jgi:hypothetical protein
MFRPGPDLVALVAGGVARLTAGAAAVETGVPLRAPQGSAAAPALGFAADPDTGLFRNAENQLGLATGGVQRAILGNAGLTLDVPMTGTATTQGPTDAGEGRLPRLRSTGGIFGLGGLDAPGVADVDDSALRTGFYRSTTTSVGTLPPGHALGTFGGSGPLVVLRHDGGSVTQWWSSLSDAQVWTRRFSGSWTGWQRATRILGPVAQVGGAATGAILERGANANGEFLRLADGKMICTRTNLSAANASTALGALFRSGDVSWTYPAAFAAAPVVCGQVDDPDVWLATGVPGVGSCTLRALSAVTKGAALTLRVTAIGRWFV